MIPKFRAWIKDVKRMVDVEFLDLSHKMLIGKDWEYGMTESIKFDEVALMQSTGLFDKNGVEIFEGDIIEWWYSEGEFISQKGKFEVIWENGAFCPGENSDETLYIFLEGCEDDWYSVIGNIYANPELVEEKSV